MSWRDSRRTGKVRVEPTLVGGAGDAAASGQAVLEKTTLGQSQNDYRDLQNSLIVPKHNRIGKEKTGEVDLKTLQTKSSKDTPFQGNLMDLDLDWRSDKLGKPHMSGENDSKGSKTADDAGEKDAAGKSAKRSAESKRRGSHHGGSSDHRVLGAG